MSFLRYLSQLVRGAGVGVVATIVDLLALVILVEGLGLEPVVANVPALLAGAAVQFVGCRHLVFRASDGALGRQILGFAITEALTLALNGFVFHALTTLSPLPYPLARVAGTFLVFIGFSFPVWRLVFRGARPA